MSQDSEDGTDTSSEKFMLNLKLLRQQDYPQQRTADQIQEFENISDADPVMNYNPAQEWYLELQELSKNVDTTYEKLATIDNSLYDARREHRKVFRQNKSNWMLDYPNSSRGLADEFLKAISENHIVDALEKELQEQTDLFEDARIRFSEMRRSFEMNYPFFIPRDGKDYTPKHASSPVTLDEKEAAFFANRSIQDVIRYNCKSHKSIKFNIITCEKSVSRSHLTQEYKRRSQLPSEDPITYDTHQVLTRIQEPTYRKNTDIYGHVIATVWVQNWKSGKYEPLPNRRIIRGAEWIYSNKYTKHHLVYVEIPKKDLKDGGIGHRGYYEMIEKTKETDVGV